MTNQPYLKSYNQSQLLKPCTAKIMLICIFLLIMSQSFQVQAHSQWIFYSSDFTDAVLNAGSLANWQIRNAYSLNKLSDCGGTSLVGGRGAFGRSSSMSRHYTHLPYHHRLRVQFLFYAIDTWEDETFTVEADGRVVYSLTLNCKNNRVYICGDDGARKSGTRVELIDVSFAHARPDLLLKLTSNLDETPFDESWGVRDLQVSYEVCGVEGVDCQVVAEDLSTQHFNPENFLFDPPLESTKSFSICSGS